jgi:hypothetical protein
MNKIQKLQYHKNIATGLFVLMLVIYIVMVIAHKKAPELTFIGYIKAFAEAAMVGALADWFAVTALFHKPLGLNIPHTNLIEERKNDIGENLGDFVVQNFLKPKQIRPYITDIKVSSFIVEWLSKESTPDKIKSFVKEIPLNEKASKAIISFLDENKHQQFLQHFFEKIATYLLENEEILQQEIKEQFSSLTPSFVKSKVAKKVANGLYLLAIKTSQDKTHPIRAEITAQLYDFAEKLNAPEAEVQLTKLLQRGVEQLTDELRYNSVLQHQIDAWVQKTAYQFVLKNKEEVGRLITHTVENWEGRELSEKLELEVGKDLQFIRINGTLVGGLVGLAIYALTQLF